MRAASLIESIVAVAPARERGLKSQHRLKKLAESEVAPARERGLKSDYETACNLVAKSLPQGSVD